MTTNTSKTLKTVHKQPILKAFFLYIYFLFHSNYHKSAVLTYDLSYFHRQCERALLRSASAKSQRMTAGAWRTRLSPSSMKGITHTRRAPDATDTSNAAKRAAKRGTISIRHLRLSTPLAGCSSWVNTMPMLFSIGVFYCVKANGRGYSVILNNWVGVSAMCRFL